MRQMPTKPVKTLRKRYIFNIVVDKTSFEQKNNGAVDIPYEMDCQILEAFV